jgi:hypothetical protein
MVKLEINIKPAQKRLLDNALEYVVMRTEEYGYGKSRIKN